MNCPNCGSPLKDGTKFCPVCGIESVYMPEKRTMVDENSERKSSKVVLKVLLGVLAAVLLSIIVCLVISFNSGNGKTLSVCGTCDKEFEGSGELCQNCVDKKKKLENSANKDEDDFQYCKSCYTKIKDSTLCSNCLSGINGTIYHGEYACRFCDKKIEKNEIAVVSYNGYVFCSACDTGHRCNSCGAPAEEGKKDCYLCSGESYDRYYDNSYEE